MENFIKWIMGTLTNPAVIAALIAFVGVPLTMAHQTKLQKANIKYHEQTELLIRCRIVLGEFSNKAGILITKNWALRLNDVSLEVEENRKDYRHEIAATQGKIWELRALLESFHADDDTEFNELDEKIKQVERTLMGHSEVKKHEKAFELKNDGTTIYGGVRFFKDKDGIEYDSEERTLQVIKSFSTDVNKYLDTVRGNVDA
ncbi:hypothetical protein [Lacticaseibacillus saniviri]